MSRNYNIGLDWLIDKTIAGVRAQEVNGDKTYHFVTVVGTLIVGCEGDCCSSSWFEQDSGLDTILGSPVLWAEEVPMGSFAPPTDEQEREADSLQTYSFVIKTAKGQAEIEMRNASNGYYGGYLTFALEA